MGDAQLVDQPDFPDTSTPDFPDTGPTTDQARQTFVQSHPDGPVEGAAALQAADTLSPMIHPSITAQNPSAVAEGLYGKPMPATSLRDKLKTLFGDPKALLQKGLDIAQFITNPLGSALGAGANIAADEIQHPGAIAGSLGTINTANAINALSVRQMSAKMAGRDDSAIAAQIDALKKQAPPDQHLSAVPEFILQNLYGMGYQAVKGGEFIADAIAQAVTLEPLRKMIAAKAGTTTLTDFAGQMNQAAEQFSGTMIGAGYRGMLDAGIPHEIAAPVAIGFGGLQAALFGLRIPGLEGVAPEATNLVLNSVKGAVETTGARIGDQVTIQLLQDATARAIAKAGVSGALTRVVKQTAIQGGYGGVMAGANVAANAIAVEWNNLVNDNKVPFETVDKIATEIGLGIAGGATLGLVAGVGGEIIHSGRLGQWVDEAASNIEETNRKAAEVQAGTPEVNVAEPTIPENPPATVGELFSDELPRTTGPDPSEKPVHEGVAPEPSSGEAPTPQAQALVEPSVTPEPTTPLVTTPAVQQPVGVPQARLEDFPISKIKAHPEILNFKEGANRKGVVEPLQGAYQRAGTAPIVLWESNDGNTYIVTGRHRLDLAQRNGEITIPSHIFRESEGFTIDMARIWDAESNIRDNQGSTRDYAAYFRATGITEEQASSRGLLAKSKGKDGYALGAYASDELYAGYRNRILPEDKAAAIARGAPRDPVVQTEAMKAAREMPSDELENYTRLLTQRKGENVGAGQPDLFGFDRSFEEQLKKEARAAAQIQGQMKDELSALRGARRLSDADRVKYLEKYGVQGGDIAQMEARISELEMQLQKWAGWTQDPELHNQVREAAGLPPREYTITPEMKLAEPAPVQKDLFAPPPETPPGKPVEMATPPEPEPQSLADFFNKTATGQREQMLEALQSAQKEGSLLAKVVEKQTRAKIAGRDSMRKMLGYFDSLDPKSFHDPEIRKTVEGILSMYTATKHTAKTMEGLQRLADAMQSDPEKYFPPSAIKRVAELGKKPLRDLSPEDVKNVYDMLKRLQFMDREQNTLTVAHQKVEKRQVLDMTMKEMKRAQEISKTIESGAFTTDKTLGGMLKKGIKEPLLGIDLHNRDMLVRSIASGGESSMTYEILQNAPVQGEKVVEARKVEYSGYLMDEAKNLKVNPYKWGNETTEVMGVPLARDYRLSIYAHSQHPLNREDFIRGFAFEDGDAAGILDTHNEAWREKFIKAVSDSMTPDEKAYVAAGFEGKRRMGTDIAPVHEATTGVPFEQVKNHTRIIRLPEGRGGISDNEVADLVEANKYTSPTAASKSYEARTGSTGPILIRRYTRDYLEQAQDAAVFVGQQENILGAMRLLKEPSYEKAIRIGYGDGAYKALVRHVQDIARQPLDFVKSIQRYKGAYITSAISGSIKTALRLFALSFRSLDYVENPGDFVHWMRGTVENIVRPKVVGERTKTWSTMYRAGATGLPEFNEALAGKTKTALGAFVKKVTTTLNKTVSAGFNMGVRGEMNTLHYMMLDRIKAGEMSDRYASALKLAKLPMDKETLKGLTGPQMMKYAYAFSEYGVQRTHAVRQPEFASVYSRANLQGYLLSPFTSEGNAWLNEGLRIVDDAKRDGGVKTVGRGLQWLVIGTVIAPIVDNAITIANNKAQGRDDPNESYWEKLAWTAAKDVSELLPGGPSIEYAVESTVRYHKQAQGADVFGMGDVPQRMTNVLTDLAFLVSSKSAKSRATAMGHMLSDGLYVLGVAVGGIPVQTIQSYFRMAQNFVKKLRGTP